jgi:M61 glycyl aminopeptidase
MPPSYLFVARTLLLTLCVIGSASAAPPPHQYRITIDPEMSSMAVEARFSFSVDTVNAKSHDAGEYLADVRDCDRAALIRLRNQRMMLPAGGIRCMSYTVDLQAAARSTDPEQLLAAGNIVVSPSLWLWRPTLVAGESIDIRFDLPEGMQVAVPWPRDEREPDAFRLSSSPESSSAPAVFGRFDYREIDVPGATLRVSVPRTRSDKDDRVDSESIFEWLRHTATDVSLAYGRFPNPSPQVVVLPVDKSRRSASAVPYGRVVRDGGEAIELFVDRDQPLEAYLRDWTATHEFSHLMLPYVAPAHRWVSEGFAQYYQNVLLARAGTYDPLEAWQKLYDGLERGRQSRPELSPNEATARGMHNGQMKVYWSGAAIALMADVTLRERSGGTQTLDDVMERLQFCCLPSERAWSGPELFETLDLLAGTPVFMPLYRRYADTAGFPDTRPVFERLGLAVSDDKVKIRRGGELQHIRTAITQADSIETGHNGQLAAYKQATRRAGPAGSR